MRQLQVLLPEALVLVLLVAAGGVMTYNEYLIQTIPDQAIVTGQVTTPVALGGFIPTGVPDVYGAELGVRYDDVSASDPRKADATIRMLGQLDRTIQLDGADLDRYINVLYRMDNGISCEYCCGARSIIFESGKPACGCAHSFAMRCLAKYLITKHGGEVTDDQIMAELAKWKTLFFPTQMQQKAQILEDQGIEPTYYNVGSNKYRGIEKGTAGGGMVGGC